MIFCALRKIVSSYFDLNTNRRPPEPLCYKMMDRKETRHLSGASKLTGQKNTNIACEPSDVPLYKLDERDLPNFRGKLISIMDQLVTYLGICVGILFSNALMNYNSTGIIMFDIQLKEIIISTIIGIVIYPNIYKKLAGTKDPFFYRFTLAVQNGVFWQVLFGSLM